MYYLFQLFRGRAILGCCENCISGVIHKRKCGGGDYSADWILGCLRILQLTLQTFRKCCSNNHRVQNSILVRIIYFISWNFQLNYLFLQYNITNNTISRSLLMKRYSYNKDTNSFIPTFSWTRSLWMLRELHFRCNSQKEMRRGCWLDSWLFKNSPTNAPDIS